MAQDETPLDERVYSEHMQNVWYMGMLENSEFHFPFMSENMLHHYFAGSPFMDWTTKNGLEIKQCQQDPYGWHFSHNRKDFEAQIASRNGTEYMIAEGAQMEFDAEGRPSKGGVYVIRKQDRRKAAPPAGKDALETLATYYVIGENVYQAPSVADVLGTRLLSASTALNKCFSTASTLPSWSPTTGHTYPTTTSTTSAATAGATAGATKPPTAPSTAPSSPSRSREPSLSASTDPRSGSSLPTTNSSSANPSSTALTSRLLRDSLAQSLTYADDPFTDENPLLGEPGNLTFTSSTAAAKKRRADAARAKEEALAAAAAAAVTVKTESKPSTPAVSPPASPGKVVKRGKEKRRRKSRHNAQSPPMSPVGGTPGTSPAPGGV
ncbi:Mediator of RNA polymerase II transcription subunit 6 [Cladosporium halotolerans]|uniref:Mediator of RNA polymerase II transcription subunit 6 n=1 Tax=Cladosporium halotolerans TaxID=1052096 RepID=A0AB34KJ69_9PEZI